MARWLSKIIVLVVCVTLSLRGLKAQVGAGEEDYSKPPSDFKNHNDFSAFRQKARVVASWQISQLVSGALVVRLRTNKKVIDALYESGNHKLAENKKAEQYLINKNIQSAFKNRFTFCKVYFIYSHSSDSLLNGIRKGIFLDSNLIPDPKIEMKENFYLLAERDYVYNSSIGFVKEDTARFMKESGTPVREMGFVIKNKYGHQLKGPFPYYVKDKTISDLLTRGIAQPALGGQIYLWAPDNDPLQQKRIMANYKGSGEAVRVDLKKHSLYKFQARMVDALNNELKKFRVISGQYFAPPPGESFKEYCY